MTMLGLIIALSTIIWYIIDRFKVSWENLKYGKYITIIVSAILSFGACFAFGLDIIFGLGLVAAISIPGKIITGLLLMSGSSAVSEIIGAIKGSQE